MLALAAFVTVGSVAFLGYLNTYSGSSNNYNRNSNVNFYPTPTPTAAVEVAPEGELRLRGDSGEYSLVVENPGPQAIRDVRITENLPNHDLEFVTSDPRPVSQESPQVIVWRAAEISGNDAATIRVQVRLKHNLKPGRIITTTPTVVYADTDGQERTADFSVKLVIRSRSE